MTRLTDTERRALEILRDHGPLMASRFGEKLWPNHPSWNKVSKCGAYGSTRGGGMNLRSGSYLGRLRRRGLVDRYWRDDVPQFDLTSEGRAALTEAAVPVA